MEIDFKDISYLQRGNARQRSAYDVITKYQILEKLKSYRPLVVGTIPINIDVERSDLDIILQTENFESLEKLLIRLFATHTKFAIRRTDKNLVCNFEIDNLPLEIYASTTETEKQTGYLHMVKEHQIIKSKDEKFIEKIRDLKRRGRKTEPAFCELLGISGNPYVEIFNYKII